MTKDNKNNYIDGFRPPSRPTPPNLRRDLNNRQPARQIIRGNYVNNEVKQTVPEQSPVNLPSASAVHQNPIFQPADNKIVSNNQTSVINVISKQQPGNISLLNPINTETTLDDDLDSLFPKNEIREFTPHQIGADLVIKKSRLPNGIYFIFILNILLVPVSFIIKSNTSIIMSLVLLAGFIFSILLLLKKCYARKFMMYFSVFVIVISITLTSLFYIQSRSTNSQFIKNFNQIKLPSTLNMSNDEKQLLANAQIKVIETRDQQIKVRNSFYSLSGFIVVENAIIIMYLSRPRVEAYFQKGNNPLS
jgi:hypothetical protein